MNEEMECMCLECGISVYLPAGSFTAGDFTGMGMKLVENLFCVECGGVLGVVGKAGDEPSYRLT